MNLATACFIPFNTPIEQFTLPEKFTFPFYYTPHPLAVRAAKQLQEHITSQTDWVHNFGIDDEMEGMVIGKMFGVMVVQNAQHDLGFLAAFSGKLANGNHHPGFVPPVFDMLEEEGFFNQGVIELNELNARTRELEESDDHQAQKNALEEIKRLAHTTIENRRLLRVENRKWRKELRLKATEENGGVLPKKTEDEILLHSARDKYELNQLTAEWNEKVALQQAIVDQFSNEIAELKKRRKEKSNDLQKRLFDEYHFRNALGVDKSVWDIFQASLQKDPPSGAGECAAPKLLQFAYLNQLKPIALAEFWWGASPKSEIRKHGQFYPACRGKCEPILGHMLEGLAVDPNPMLENPAEGKSLPIVYEDDQILVVNKPAEFLSVPGKTITDCVYTRISHQYPNATGPLIIHRLDMATSGILLLAKTKKAHKYLQYQFIHRTIDKTYIALLDGIVEGESGLVDLPLRIDVDDRPRQLVCYEHGKPAQTEWKVVERKDGKTRVEFHPITGRTHQLRMHAAHYSGLNVPIVGDDLYGTKADRLHLHAASLTFRHPESKEMMTIQVAPEF